MKALESSETKHFALECKLRDAERSLAERMAEGDDTAAALDTELIRAQAERDVYKRLYEQLLDRMSN